MNPFFSPPIPTLQPLLRALRLPLLRRHRVGPRPSPLFPKTHPHLQTTPRPRRRHQALPHRLRLHRIATEISWRWRWKWMMTTASLQLLGRRTTAVGGRLYLWSRPKYATQGDSTYCWGAGTEIHLVKWCPVGLQVMVIFIVDPVNDHFSFII